MHPFFTIGHSTRSTEEFAGLLQESQVGWVADVRTVARSRTNPQFNPQTLAASLAPYQIGYSHLAALGGLRGRQKLVPQAVNALWQNRSFRNYADYAGSPAFREAMEQLLELGAAGRVAMMCAEAVWWRCHRRIIADYLLARGLEVFHIMAPHTVVPATLTPGAVVSGECVTYPLPP
jgi:uncharacterized protein (DUF488 family)